MKRIIISILLSLLILQTLPAQKLGLVMSGGGARGLAHIGVIKALEENNIPIDYVSGTSIGAIVAALYSMGYSPQEMIDIMSSEDFKKWYTGTMDINYMFYFRKNNIVPELINIKFNLKDSVQIERPSLSIINPNPMNLGFMQTFAQYNVACNNNFDSLFVPFRCVASDIYNKKQVIYKEGDLGDAVRASMSYPFVFRPIKKDSILMYDGGIYNNFPADIMERDFNPDVIIGSVVSENATLPDDKNLMNQIENFVMNKSNYSIGEKKGIVLNMDLKKITLLDFHKLDEIVKIGYEQTISKMDSIKGCIERKSNSTEIAERRKAFKKRLPEFRFKNIEITGIDEKQQGYIKKEFHREGEIFDFEHFKRTYYRILSGNTISTMIPRAIYNQQDSTFTLHLDVEVNPPFSLKMGGAISTNNSNQIYYALHYRRFKNRSMEFILDGQLGKVYNNAQLSGRIDLAARVPLSLKLTGSVSTIDYYNMKYIFSKENTIALNHQREFFVKAKMMLPFFLRKKAEFGIGYGNIKDEYIASNIIDLDLPQFDRNTMNFFGASLKFEGNTLNSNIFATSGTYESLKAQYFIGNEEYKSFQKGETQHTPQSWLQMSYLRKDHFNFGKRFTLGTLLHLYYSTRGVSGTYQATMMQTGAFTPTMNSMYNYDPAFRASQFIAGGVSPIFKITDYIQLRGGFYSFIPYRRIYEQSDGSAHFSKKIFDDFQYIAELSLAGTISTLSINAFLEYYSSHNKGVDVGITIGWFMFNERFIE